MEKGNRENLLTKLLEIRAKEGEEIEGVKPPFLEEKKYEELLNQVSQLRGRGLFYPYIGSGLGKGPYVKLANGSVKLDFISGIGVHVLGHSHPEVMKASLKGALEDVVMQGHLQANLIYIELLKKVQSLAQRNSRLTYGWICPSGSMANENALKLIRQKKSAAPYIVAFEGAFAGRSTMMLEITDNEKIKEGLPSYGEVLRIPFTPENPNKALEALKNHYENKKEKLGFFILEFMQGDGGYFKGSPQFFKPLLEFCKEKGIAVWADEVQTFLRSGEFFAFEKLGLGDWIDVCTIGKSIQLSMTLWTEEYNPTPQLISGTFASSSSSLHSALAILNTLDQGFMGKQGRIEKIYQAWTSRLKTLEEKGLLSEIEGWGLMVGATPLDGNAQKVKRLLHLLFEKGLLIFSCGPETKKRIRFLLPAILEEKHLDEALFILEEGLRELK